MLKHYVEFDEPGALFPESSSREVKERAPSRLRKIPEYTYALHFYDREEVNQNGELLIGKRKNHSQRILFGKIYTLEEIAQKEGTDSILYRNIARTETQKGIKCNMGNWQTLYKADIVIADVKELRKLNKPI